MSGSYADSLVLGLGISGVSAARLLLSEGCRVVAVDGADTEELRKRAASLRDAGAEVVLGAADVPAGNGHGRKFDVCIVSPGIPPDGPWMRKVEAAGVEIVSEIELGASRCRCRLLAVTGSKGKSTMVKLCAEALALGGLNTAIAGNYGIPFCDVAMTSRELDWVVLEVSSFQLERVKDFHPHVGVLLNVQPDHLDRRMNEHPEMDQERVDPLPIKWHRIEAL